MGLTKPRPVKTPSGTYCWQGERNFRLYNAHIECEYLSFVKKEMHSFAHLRSTDRNYLEYLTKVKKIVELLPPESKIKVLNVLEDEQLFTNLVEAEC